MKSKFTRILLAMAFVVSVAALAQTGSAAAAPSSAASSSGSAPAAATGAGTKIGTISMEQAIFATNEGRRDFEALSKKLEPKQNELKGANDEIESLKKQLNTQGDKLNEEARANLVKQIETKQKSLDRQLQDAREDAQNQQNEIAQRILQKLGPVLIKYATDNGFGMIVDMKPIPHILPVSVDGKLPTLESVQNDERDQLFRKVKRAVVVGTVGNDNW